MSLSLRRAPPVSQQRVKRVSSVSSERVKRAWQRAWQRADGRVEQPPYVVLAAEGHRADAEHFRRRESSRRAFRVFRGAIRGSSVLPHETAEGRRNSWGALGPNILRDAAYSALRSGVPLRVRQSPVEPAAPGAPHGAPAIACRYSSAPRRIRWPTRGTRARSLPPRTGTPPARPAIQPGRSPAR